MFSAASVYVLHRGFVPRPHTNHKTSLKRGFAIASFIRSGKNSQHSSADHHRKLFLLDLNPLYHRTIKSIALGVNDAAYVTLPPFSVRTTAMI